MDDDRISYLPPFIIHQMMSHLFRKQVAQTSVLSKRWNHLRASFPIFNFDETDLFKTDSDMRLASEEEFCERIENFMKFIDVSLLRFCEHKVSMQAFRLLISLADVEGLPCSFENWIRLAVENDVKELDITIKTDENKLYILPQIIFFAKLLTTLKLNGFKLEKPPDTIRFCFLKKLKLVRVHISEPMVQKITSDCVLLEELYFLHCWGLKCVYICKPDGLKILHIQIAPNEHERVKIDILGLQQCDLMLYQRSCEIDMNGCSQLKDLRLGCCIFRDREFHYFLSKFPLLENLSMQTCHYIERIKFSSDRLKNLSIGNCSYLEAIDVDTPNLLSFVYQNDTLPISSMNAPCPWMVRLVIEGDLDTTWCLKLKKFLAASTEIKELTLYCTSNKVLFDLEEFRRVSPSPPYKVCYVSLFPTILPSDYETLLDALLWICYPKCLSVEAWDKKDHINLIESIYVILTNRDLNCCNSCDFKCWRHYLKDVKIESFLPLVDPNPIIIDNLMDVLPNLPPGSLRLHLDWCFSGVDKMI
ncbi:F-box/LRR-repeat protein At3g58980-like [Pistacia vera]|uniref:F-box/LRR-repeat protein At3g58980-like n=1 Tax=Pistacia vera TaxID=55513 RepID=UPI0012631484|nr:F-box/LRR-repeat protein At3g58980-like [Pistacia vera]